MQKNLSKILLVVAFFAMSVSFTGSAFAASSTTKPGNGFGDKNHQHMGPPGVSVRSQDNISIINNITIIAEGATQVVVNVTNNIYHNIFG